MSRSCAVYLCPVSLLAVGAASRDPCVPPGDFLYGSSGFFSSPNFPSNFPINSDCTWDITVPAGRIIKVTFLSFALDPS
ncbi:procollagen C-endopeptidase enhancer 2-like, partial [Orbicella faveolata]|uniref:procollagen C-endopeptidase enhancer 2-like n=1 Tax=Orbicella faveolata TaxID=48498 RepID=UPI0009E20DEC